MKNLLSLLLTLFLATSINAQGISDVKIKSKKYGLSKMKKAQKKIYINSFNVGSP